MISKRDDIQGLRAIAVLSVIFFHAFPQSFLSGGFVGVDIFFVISGYLITQTISRDVAAGRWSIAEFYRRRVRRIMPALLVVTIFTATLGIAVLSPGQYEDLWRSIMSSMLFVSNLYFWRTTGYFEAASETKPMLHTWSLSVEEQFYLIYPLLLSFILVRFPSKTPGIIAALAVGLLLFCQMILIFEPTWAYFLTPARAFELLIGCTAALTAKSPRVGRYAAQSIGAAGLAMMVLPLFLYDSQTLFPGVAAAIPCIGAALLLWIGNQASTFAGKSISNRPMVIIGNWSYSLYLWHWPLLALPRAVLGLHLDPLTTFALIALTFAVSFASYRWIEGPFLGKNPPRLPYLRLATASIVVLLAAGLAVGLADGFPQRFSAESRKLFAANADFSPERQRCHQDSTPVPFAENCVFGSSEPTIAIWGDSHAVEIAYELARRVEPTGKSVMQISASACPPSLGWVRADRPLCAQHNAETLAGIIASPSLKAVVLVAYLQNDAYGDQATLLTGYDRAVEKLQQAGKKVLMVTPIPTYDFDVPTRLGVLAQLGWDLETVGQSRLAFENEVGPIRAELKKLDNGPNIDLIDLTDLFCDQTQCHVFDANVGSLYFNMNHIAASAARRAVIRIASLL